MFILCASSLKKTDTEDTPSPASNLVSREFEIKNIDDTPSSASNLVNSEVEIKNSTDAPSPASRLVSCEVKFMIQTTPLILPLILIFV